LRRVTYCRKKKDLIKRAMQLSLMCGQQIRLVIYDNKKKRMTEFQSHEDFNFKAMCDAKKIAKSPENIF